MTLIPSVAICSLDDFPLACKTAGRPNMELQFFCLENNDRWSDTHTYQSWQMRAEVQKDETELRWLAPCGAYPTSRPIYPSPATTTDRRNTPCSQVKEIRQVASPYSLCQRFPYAPFNAMVTKISKWSRIQDSFRITPKIESPVVYAMPDMLSKFQKDPSITFRVILLTHRQTDRQTNKQT